MHTKESPLADLSGLTDRRFDPFQPIFLGEGGVQVVFSLRSSNEDRPPLVAKVSKVSVADWLFDQENTGVESDTLQHSLREDWEKHIRQLSANLKLMRNIFGTEHVVPEKYFITSLPTTTSMLEYVVCHDWRKRPQPASLASVSESWAIVSLQPYCVAACEPRLSFHFDHYAEVVQPHQLAELQALTTSLTKVPYSLPDELIERFFQLQDSSSSLELLISAAQQNPELKDSLQDFIGKCIDFANQSGTILAMGGQDNVFFHKRSDGWTYTLLDPLTIHDEPLLTVARSVRDKEPENLVPLERTALMKANNFVRVINGVASILNLEGRVTCLN